jgi:hypothetical protein
VPLHCFRLRHIQNIPPLRLATSATDGLAKQRLIPHPAVAIGIWCTKRRRTMAYTATNDIILYTADVGSREGKPGGEERHPVLSIACPLLVWGHPVDTVVDIEANLPQGCHRSLDCFDPSTSTSASILG